MDVSNDDCPAKTCGIFSGPPVDVSEPPWEYLYVKVADHIIASIRSGLLKRGDKFPPEEVLASFYGISGHTLRRAMQVLRTNGWIVTRQGRGTFVKIIIEGESPKSGGDTSISRN